MIRAGCWMPTQCRLYKQEDLHLHFSIQSLGAVGHICNPSTLNSDLWLQHICTICLHRTHMHACKMFNYDHWRKAHYNSKRNVHQMLSRHGGTELVTHYRQECKIMKPHWKRTVCFFFLNTGTHL